MKTYFIESVHDVYIDDYNEGETTHVNFYDIKQNVKAENTREAINKFFEKILFYKFNFENAIITNEEDENEPVNRLEYSVLVDEENNEASEIDIEKWKKNKKTLFANNITIYINELQPVRI